MSESELASVFENWPAGQQELVALMKELKGQALARPGAAWELVSRPGVSHSLRFTLQGSSRPVVMLLDAAYLAADMLTISVCFYADMVDDPEEMGEEIPGGLLGQDGYCFDADEEDPGAVDYLKARVDAAFGAAAREAARG